MEFGISYASLMFFIGISMILFVKSNSKLYHQPVDFKSESILRRATMVSALSNYFTPESEATDVTPTTSEVTSSDHVPQYSDSNLESDSYLSSVLRIEKQVKCEQLKRRNFEYQLIDILSPEIFLQADPFRYLFDKTMEIQYNHFVHVRQVLNKHLQAEEFPSCYVPYAKTLFSLLRCWPDVFTIGRYIRFIQNFFSKNDADLSFLPSDVSLSPELAQLFSSEILGDPKPPQRIFYKLMDMPKGNILNLVARLQKFIERTMLDLNISFRNKQYIWYADAVWKFLKNESAFDDLKRDMAEIQRLATSNKRFSSAKSTITE